MTRNDFLNALYRSLLYLPAKERQEIMQDYEEHFAAGLEQGKTEEEICRALGDPGEIAQTYLQQSKAGEDGAYQASSAAPRSPAGEATAPIRPCPSAVSDNGNRVLYTVLFILDMIFFALLGIPGGFALAAAGAAILITSVAAGIFVSSALLALFFISLSIALISAGVLTILLITWSLRACYQRMR